MSDWSIDSWEKFEAKQQPQYGDKETLNDVLGELRQVPPLVFSGEVEKLKERLKLAARGEAFILQGGDCAERFEDCTPDAITSKLKILLQMSLILTYGTRKSVVRIGRIAGQYGKPRSSPTEKVDGQEMPVFRGDNVNAFQANLQERTPNPTRLLRGYHCSAMTLNFIRALIDGGFADLHNPEHWDLTMMASDKVRERYEDVIGHIRDAISFIDSIGASKDETLQSVNFFTSHEGLILPFEAALTRLVPVRNKYYDLSAHMLWVGDRTRDLDGAHLEFFRGVANPIGCKVGPTASPEDIIAVIKKLNPENEEGKMVLITRFGHDKVADHLPKFLKQIQAQKLNVVWEVDPMHGNIIKTTDGTKTRNFDDILSELKQTLEIHQANDSHLGGVHFEMTGEDVTECTGGAEGLSETDLAKNYVSYCDPRLNYSQSLEMAFLISELYK